MYSLATVSLGIAEGQPRPGIKQCDCCGETKYMQYLVSRNFRRLVQDTEASSALLGVLTPKRRGVVIH
jgi:hypothetical protein